MLADNRLFLQEASTLSGRNHLHRASYGGKLGFLCVALKSYMKQRDRPDGYPSISSPFAHYFWLHEYNFIFLLFFFQAVTVP